MIKLVSEFEENDELVVQLLVVSATKGVNNNGAAYLSLELRDSSGSINGKKWDASIEDDSIFVPGGVIEARVSVIKYKDNLQLKVLSAKLLSSDEVDVTRFIKKPPIPKEALIEKFNNFVASIKDETCSKLLNYFINKFKDKLFDYPAASSIHHEYSSGLLMHVTSMADLGDFLSKLYNDIDRDLLITAILLHDVGKVIELEGPVVYHYSLEGKLVGHISIMASEIRMAAEKLSLTGERIILLEHMILSHHGQLEFGSPVLPETKEALLLSLIDNLDSKMVIVGKALEGVTPGEFTNKVYPLDGRCFYKPKGNK